MKQSLNDLAPSGPECRTRAPWLFARLCTACLAVGVVRAPAATAQPAAGDRPPIVVYGKRASVASAQETKRQALEIVDSVVADDIIKLPDFSVADAIQRVTGVQITQDRGEGANIVIRGLSQVETTLNGREVFTAGSGRTLNFTDIPAEMISRIDVYKTASAAQIEGGVGGSVDLTLHRPFDFSGPVVAGSARAFYDDPADRTGGEYSALLSGRRQIRGGGDVGLLVNLFYQRRGWREDQDSTGNPLARTDLVPGATVIAPNGVSQTTSIGDRERTGANFALQWRPTSELEFYAEGALDRFRTIQDSYQINVTASPTFLAGSPALFAGTDNLKHITWTNASISVLSFARDTVDRTAQGAIGSVWKHGPLTLDADLSRTDSRSNLFFSGPFFAGTAASFTQDLSAPIPGSSIAGTNLLDPATFHYTGVAYRTQPFQGDLTTARIDADYRFAGGFFDSLSGGLRYAGRNASDGSGLIFADAGVSGLSVASLPGFVMPNPYANFFPGVAAPAIRDFLVGNLALARNPLQLRSDFGVTAPIPTSNPLGTWRIGEETDAAYLMARFSGFGQRLDGDIGLRWVSTREAVSGEQSVPTTGAIAPIRVNRTDTDLLPSLNLRYRLGEGLYLRAAASKTVTRQDFSQLSPSLTLIPNPVNPSLNQGSAGNPNLRPVRSDNLDLAIEKYFGPTTAIYATGFVKQVDGFLVTVSSPEAHDGQTYQVSRPQNGASGDIRGFEVGYQQFFDFLPGRLHGLGLQANYTFVDSATLNPSLGRNVALQNLSKHSYNLIGIYEHGRLSARLAYNWRSRFLSSVINIVGVGALPIYTDANGWLDASMSYRLSDQVALSLEGVNLLGTVRRSYYGVSTRPQSAWADDTQVTAAATVRF